MNFNVSARKSISYIEDLNAAVSRRRTTMKITHDTLNIVRNAKENLLLRK